MGDRGSRQPSCVRRRVHSDDHLASGRRRFSCVMHSFELATVIVCWRCDRPFGPRFAAKLCAQRKQFGAPSASPGNSSCSRHGDRDRIPVPSSSRWLAGKRRAWEPQRASRHGEVLRDDVAMRSPPTPCRSWVVGTCATSRGRMMRDRGDLPDFEARSDQRISSAPHQTRLPRRCAAEGADTNGLKAVRSRPRVGGDHVTGLRS